MKQTKTVSYCLFQYTLDVFDQNYFSSVELLMSQRSITVPQTPVLHQTWSKKQASDILEGMLHFWKKVKIYQEKIFGAKKSAFQLKS